MPEEYRQSSADAKAPDADGEQEQGEAETPDSQEPETGRTQWRHRRSFS